MSNVFISIDTEFSAGGLFSGTGSPVTDQAVYCRVNGKPQGLDFILDTLAQNGLKATFFVEAAHTAHLGHDAMRQPVEDIKARGHDIQLHLHPMWLHATDHFPGDTLTDAVSHLGVAQLHQLFEVGLEAFEKWGLAKPVAFRAGNLQMGRQVYDVMAHHGIPVSSSVGTAIHRSDDPSLWLDHGHHVIGDVIEVPVFGYAEMQMGKLARRKNLTITGCGRAEIRAVLNRAMAAGHEDIVILTHPFEFIKRHDPGFRKLSVNRVTQRRLKMLCQMIATDDRLQACTFAERVGGWQASSGYRPAAPRPPLMAVATRMIENKLSNWLAWY